MYIAYPFVKKKEQNMKSSQEVKQDIPFLSHYDYWESIAVGPTLRPVIDAMLDYYKKRPFNYLVGDCQPAKEANAQVEKSIVSVANLINAAPAEVTLYPQNTTEAIAMVIDGLPFNEGDEIVGANIDHMSAYVPILRLMKNKGINFKLIKADRRGWVDVEEYKKRLTNKTKLIILCHAGNIFGTILDIKSICAFAKENELFTMIDAAQTVGRMPIDVKEIGCDFLNICGRKHLCGPQGTAGLYMRKELVELLEPIIIGGISTKLIGDFEYELWPGIRRYNAGILNTSGVIGLGKAVDYWQEIGMTTIREHCVNIQEYLFEGIEEIGGVIYSPRENDFQVGIISFVIEGVDPDMMIKELEEKYRIIIRSGSPGSPVFRELGVKKVNRCAPHYYTTLQDANRLLQAMKSVRDKIAK
jgi:cysteine desulfurase/selenocysteine lyase